MDTWILSNCRRAARNQVVAFGLLILGGLLVIGFNWRYLINFVGGPFPTAEAELSQILDVNAEAHYFVQIAAGDVIDTGVYEESVETENGVEQRRYVSARFYAARMGKHFLIVRSEWKPPATVSGELKPLPADLRRHLLPPDASEAASASMYPFYLDTEGFRTAGYWGLGAGIFLMVLLVYYGRGAWIRSRDPSKHPVAVRAEGWGDPITTAAQVEDEFRNKVRYKVGSTRFTGNYVIVKSLFVFDVHRFEDLVWVYKKVVKQSMYFIPVGKDHYAILHFYGGALKVKAAEKAIAEIVEYASNRAPWAVLGYSKELEKRLSKDVQAFCASVKARRREIAAGSRQGASEGREPVV